MASSDFILVITIDYDSVLRATVEVIQGILRLYPLALIFLLYKTVIRKFNKMFGYSRIYYTAMI